MGAGYSHSAFIDTQGKLYVWGDNSRQTLQQWQDESSKQTIIKQPQEVQLNDFIAEDVACGPSFVMYSAYDKKMDCIIKQDTECANITKKLLEELLKSQSLFSFFMEDGKYLKEQQNINPDFLAEQQKRYQKDQGDYEINKEAFRSRIEEQKIDGVTEQQIKSFENQSIFQKFNLQRIEDYVLGFYQQRTKVFIIGEAPVPLFGKKIIQDHQGHFQTSIKKAEEIIQEDRKKKVHSYFKLTSDYKDYKQQIDSEISATPLVIEFPKFTKPIVSVSAGLGHALALSNYYEMYSWGLANYGALGFGYKNNNHLKMPKKLEIIDHHSQIVKIIQISCGKYHSMCLTFKNEIFSWGESSLGRLGLGQSIYDILEPKLLQKISYREPFFISAGESHSAAITKDYQLYTWGNGGYGRLGHGYDSNIWEPLLVEALQIEKVIHVSCGSMHTLVSTKSHQVYAFGQTKYGKLGIHYQNLNQEYPIDLPTKISMYKMKISQEIADQQEIFQVFASVNHSLALNKQLDLYSWGYSGKGLLGRDNQQKSEMGFPIPQLRQSKNTKEQEDISSNFQNLLINFHESEDNFNHHKHQKDDQQVNLHFQIEKICCNVTNTVILSNHGEVFVYGDNTFGQRGCKEIMPQYFQNDMFKDYKKYSMPSLIQFKNISVKIVYVSCGGFHIFAKTNLDEVYGWGRADEGQLGVGILTDKVFEPTLIEQISFEGIKQICCGDNFSGALSIFGEVYVTGSLDGGKLGLGKGFRNGFVLKFQKISKQFLPRIEYIACGATHMMAISKKQGTLQSGEMKADGLTYSWGKNQRGQLGIGSKETQYSPKEIKGCKELLIKVQCGFNFSLGLSQTNKVYFWGNFKYFCSADQLKDVEEPRVISKLEGDEVKDITCSYKQCFALLKNGKIRQWGRYLNKKDPKSALVQNKKVKKTDQELGQLIKFIGPFPTTSKFQVEFDSIYTSQNHSIALTTINKKLYSWGFNNLQNRLGLSKKYYEEKALNEPIEDDIMKNIFLTQVLNIEKNTINQEQKTDNSDKENSEEGDQQIHQEEEKQTNMLGLKNEQDENNSNQDLTNPQDVEVEMNESKKDVQIKQQKKEKQTKKPQKTQDLESLESQ